MPTQFIQYFNMEYSVIPIPQSVQMLKPTIFRHGEEWCASSITGNKQNIIVFAPTPELAMLAFEKRYMAVMELEAVAD